MLTIVAGLGGWWCGGFRQSASPTQTEAKSIPSNTSESTGATTEAVERFRIGFARIESTFLLNSSTSELRLSVVSEAEALASEDFPGAIGTALQNDNSSLHGIAYQLATLWAERDPRACRAWIMGLPRPNDQRLFISATGEAFSKVDPSGYLEWFAALSPLKRQQFGAGIINSLADAAAATDPDLGIRLILEQGTQARNVTGLERIFSVLAKKDAATAAARASELPGGAALTGAVEGVMRVWGQSDPAAARAWIGTLDDAMLSAHATAAFAEGLAMRDPRAAAEMVGALPGTRDFQDTLQQIVRIWSDKDAPGVLSWIEKLPSADDRSSLAAAAIAGQIEESPDAALEQMFAHPKLMGIETGFAMARAIENIGSARSPEPWLRRIGELPREAQAMALHAGVQAWAGRDMAAARAWVSQQPGETLRPAAYAAIGEVAAKKDPAEFKTWIGSVQPGVLRDAAMLTGTGELVGKARGADRVALFDLAATASDQRQAHYWVRRFAMTENADPELDRWVAATALLSAQEKAMLRADRSTTR